MDERTLLRSAFTGWAKFALAMALMIFVPAWTLRYWQGWAFWVVFFGCSLAITLDLFRHDRSLLERRLRG
ncbi:MAG TPA: hypothetical protein VF664_06315, partial [Cystobacter sp.]